MEEIDSLAAKWSLIDVLSGDIELTQASVLTEAVKPSIIFLK